MEIDLKPLLDGWQFIAYGLWITVVTSALSIVLSVTLGAAMGIARCYGSPWTQRIVAFYVDSQRAIPVLVVLVWMYFAFPLVVGFTLPPLTAAVIGIGIHLAAYVCEVVRAGLLSVREGQARAGLALGMSTAQVIRKIVMPQAIVRMLPAFGSIIVITIKDSAIASVIAVPELIRQSETLAGQTFRPFEIYTATMLLYFVILFPITRGVEAIYRRVAPLGAS